MIVATHNPAIAARADRVLHLLDGRLVRTSDPGAGRAVLLAVASRSG